MNKIDFFLAISKGEIEDEKTDQFIKEQTNSLDENRLLSLLNEFRAFIYSDIHFMSYEGFEMPEFKSLNCEVFLSKIISYMPNHKLITPAEIVKERGIYKTLKKVNEGEYSKLESLELVDKLTDKKMDKLKALKNDISEFIFHEGQPYRAGITKENIRELLETYESNNIEPPLILKIYNAQEQKWKDRTDSQKLDFESGKHKKEDFLNIKEAFYSSAFLNIDLFELLVDELIDEIELDSETVLEPNKKDVYPIQWEKSEELLKDFLDALKEKGFIEERDTKDIINEHFKIGSQLPTNEPRPIKMLKTNRLLAYLIFKLTQSGLIDDSLSMWQIIGKHFSKSNGESFKIETLVSDWSNTEGYNYKPKGHKTIDKIFEALKS